MKSDIIHQEILLVTGTTFSQKQLTGTNENDENKNLSEIEQLEKACWDGALSDLLPEVIKNRSLHVWQIWDTNHSLQIELSEYPSEEARFSLNPYYFLKTTDYN